MMFKVASLYDEDWSKTFLKLDIDSQDIYLSPNYYQVMSSVVSGEVEALCALYEDNEAILIYPFLKRRVPAELSQNAFFDIEGAYGYNGYQTKGMNKEYYQKFYEAFSQYCRKEKIIAEFTRFNPNYPLPAESYWKVTKANHNIVVDLGVKDLVYDSYEHSTRKNLKKTEREGLMAENILGKDLREEQLNDFYDIYIKTMDRNNANSFYYFDKVFFQIMAREFPGQTLFTFILHQGKRISCELVPFNSYVAYSFLGGTLSDYYHLSPNTLLKHEIILFLKNLGLSQFCLGGGVSLDDGIYKYKKTFAKNGVKDFYIGKKIHDEETYAQVVSVWENKYPDKALKFKNILLKYQL